MPSSFRLGLTATVLALMTGCASASTTTDDAAVSAEALKLSSGLTASDFTGALDKASIRALDSWVDDPTFESKWTAMLASPIAFLGGASAAYHADFGGMSSKRFPKNEGVCHGDPKFDNFGWTQVTDSPAEGGTSRSVYSDNDFDDAGYCPVAIDAIHYLLATDLWFSDPSLDDAALSAYVDTVDDLDNAVVIDSSLEPNWSKVRTKGLAKATANDRIVLGGEVAAATATEVADLRALAASDARFPSTVLDVTRDVRVDGGSAGLRRFWILGEDAGGARSLVELKELTANGTSFGPHATGLDFDAAGRFDVLKEVWWNSSDPGDHFEVTFDGALFMVRDRLARDSVKDTDLDAPAIEAVVRAQASELAGVHRSAWGHVSKSKLKAWLAASAATVTARWRAAFAAAGGATN